MNDKFLNISDNLSHRMKALGSIKVVDATVPRMVFDLGGFQTIVIESSLA